MKKEERLIHHIALGFTEEAKKDKNWRITREAYGTLG